MSFIAKYIANTLSRIHPAAALPSTCPSTSTSPTQARILTTSAAAVSSSTSSSPSPSPTHAPIPAFPRGLVLTTAKPCLKAPVASPKLTPELAATPPTHAPANTSVTSGYSFDISLISDTSSNSPSYFEDEHSGVLTLSTPLDHNVAVAGSHDMQHEIDLFSPRPVYSDSGSPYSPVGLGISGIPRKDGKPGAFDGLGLVGVRHSYYHQHRNPFLADDEDDEDGYASPTPRRFRRRDGKGAKNDADEWAEEDSDASDALVSETFFQELVHTWEADPLHMRFLSTIPECDAEDEEESTRQPLMTSKPAPLPEAVLPMIRTKSTSTQRKLRRRLRMRDSTGGSVVTRGKEHSQNSLVVQ